MDPQPARSVKRWRRVVLQLRPVAVLLAPSLVGIALDVALRGGALRSLALRQIVGWLGASFVGAGVWIGILWPLARLALQPARHARAVYAAGFALVVFPLAACAYGLQIYYHEIFDAYITRDTIRLGVALRGTVMSWLGSFGVKMVPAIAAAAAFTGALAYGVRRVAPDLKQTRSLAPMAMTLGCLVLLWRDSIETSEFMQSPDASFINGLVGLARDRIIPQPMGGLANRQGVTLTDLPRREHQPNILLILTESVRADAMCSEKTPSCASRFLDDAIPDRIGLTKATAQSSGTVTSCMVLWTGLGPEADFHAAHEAPLLWEVAKSEGYRTAYVTSQDMRVFGLGAYLKTAGIDVRVVSDDLGGVRELHIGAPDERAAARLVDFVKGEKGPWFAVLHFSNTHFPYRTIPELEPNVPHDDSPFPKDLTPLVNQYKNSILLQERTIAGMYAELRKLPGWDDTITIFLSDHGEGFREHGSLFHLNTLFDEEVRVPAWITAGKNVLADDELASIRSFHDARVFPQDLHATILDLLGAFDVRRAFPRGGGVHGRSLLRGRRPGVIADEADGVTLSTTSGVWFDDDAVYGVMTDDQKLLGTDHKAWTCFDLVADPGEKDKQPGTACAGPLLTLARERFPTVPAPPSSAASR